MRLDSPMMQNGMILQRGKEFPLTGRGKDDECIKVEFQGQTYETKVQNGVWNLLLKTLQVGGPYELTIESAHETKHIEDILVGDVYFLSGQSNMALEIQWIYHSFKDEIDANDYDQIREFRVPITYNFVKPQDQLSGEWHKAMGEQKFPMSALGYFFAKKRYETTKVPIGMIQTGVPGAPIEAFLKREYVDATCISEIETDICKSNEKMKNVLMQVEADRIQWDLQLKATDCGWKNDKDRAAQYSLNMDRFDWDSCEIPILIKSKIIENKSGVIWFHKEISLTEEDLKTDAILKLGLIVESDITYINGVEIGTTDYQYPPRRYVVPCKHLQLGGNSICIRVVFENGICRFWEEQEYCLTTSGHKYDLTVGEWNYKYGAILESPAPEKIFFEYKPVGLYNAMIAPLAKYPFAGILWYQGESNTHNPLFYSQKLQVLIQQLREEFEDEHLPFYFVQIADYKDINDEDGTKWRALRQEQEKTLLVDHTKMVVSMDVGDRTDLHPQNKKAIGERLALCTLEN
ncbi:sialate O-acetylesterase [Lachnospiraceae bacterium ZAX-1]